MKNTTLPCPRCGEMQASIAVNLNCLEDDNSFTCLECNADFSVDLLRAIFAQWGPTLAWLEKKPDTGPL